MKFNIPNKSNRSFLQNQTEKSVNIFNNTFQKNQETNDIKSQTNYFIFKAKSIDKNINKYPIENSNKYKVKEENKKYTDPLTVKQELIPRNLRGKRYYMNYLYNIHDKDLKEKYKFKVNKWENEI